MSLEREWRALEPQMAELPFVTFDWVAAWWKCLRSDRLTVRDSLCFLTFRQSSGELCGIAPLMMRNRPGSGPLRIRQLQFIGADPNLTELRCLSAPLAMNDAVHAALVDHLRAHQPPCDWIRFTGITSAAQLGRIENAFGALRWRREIPDYVLQLGPNWEEFKGGLPRNIKESLRKCYNAPKRDGVELEWVTLAKQGPELEHAVSDLLRLHAARSTLPNTVAHPNVFRSAASRQFLREVCSRFAMQDRLRVYQLRHNGAVVATRIGFVCNRSLYLYYSGFDPAYAKYSVMTRVVAEAMRDAIASGLTTVNLSVGHDVSKARWRPEKIVYHEAEVAAPSAWSRSKYRAFKAISYALRQN